MTAVPSKTRIVNAAYAELGSQTIVNADNDTSGPANRAFRLWDDIVAELLADHPWNFQIARKTLNGTGDVDLTGQQWAYACALPENCARWLPPAENDPQFFRGEREGRFLLVDREPPISIRFIRNDVAVAEWAPHFVRAVILALAVAMSEGLTQKQGLKDRLSESAARTLARAKRIDGMESGLVSRVEPSIRSDWLMARRIPNYQETR